MMDADNRRPYLRGGATQQQTQRVTMSMMPPIQPIANYRFPCAMDSKPSIESGKNSVLGDLEVSSSKSTTSNETSSVTTDYLKCPFVQFADGVQSTKLLESSNTMAELQPYFVHADALAVEVWVTPTFVSEMTEESAPILSIAESSKLIETTGQTYCDGIQFSIAQLGNLLEVRYKDFYDYYPQTDDDYANDDIPIFGCRRLIVPDVTLKYQDLNHIVVLWKQAGAVFQIYINGEKVVDFDLLGGQAVTLPYNLQSWDPTYNLQFFANTMSTRLFPGLIHKASIYNQNLLTDDILALYHMGLEDRKREYVFDPNHPLHLVASPWNVSLVQGEYAILGVGGDYNVSTPFWNIMVEFLSLPQYGDLIKQDSLKVLKVGERVPVDGGLSRAKLIYQQTREDYFSVPKYSFNGTALPHGGESFGYRLVAVNADDPQQLVGWSEPVHQNVVIIHTNHPPVLEISDQVQRPPGGQPKEANKRPFATLGTVNLLDELDYNINRVRVDLWTHNGSLSIMSEEARKLADFESCARRPTPLSSSSIAWQCHGDGFKDTNMTFLATPQDVSAILSSMQYDAFHWNQADSIIIRVFDGSGGSCLTEEEHSLGRFIQPNGTVTEYRYQTVHSDCFSIVRQIIVPPLVMPLDISGIHGYLYRVFVDLNDWSWADAVSWGFVLLLVYFIYRVVRCCCGCCGKCIRRRHTAAIHVENPATSTRTLESLDLEVLTPVTTMDSDDR
ncbi:hypothetical protein IV203_023560 [Nitzschia inconspicua]|uniref:Uncharacterized protein n=1 Tax=Nitzschia inconspicua TaxID=303405 RepID=A0A9K3PBL0_9STRA|nr:hypothetical protein IV203_023560 [Nitzschia inconspicua]